MTPFIKRILRNNSLSNLEYLINHGFKHGKNFNCYSVEGIDSNWPWLIEIGDDVTISSNVNILAHDASTNVVGCHTKIGKVKVGNNVFIGAKSVVLCNVTIGDNVVVGAGSVVTKNIPSNSVYAGNPAKYIMSYDDYKLKHTDGLRKHHYFDEHNWNEWIDAGPDAWNYMKETLGDDIGYV